MNVVRRRARGIFLFVFASALVIAFFASTPPPDLRHRWSLATAYAALVFLALSLLLGPLRVLRRQPWIVHHGLRRDLGIAAGLLALVHTAIGLTVHLRGRMWMYFFRQLHPLRLQWSVFGAANFLGAAAASLLLLLLTLSNDQSLRALGGGRAYSVGPTPRSPSPSCTVRSFRTWRSASSLGCCASLSSLPSRSLCRAPAPGAIASWADRRRARGLDRSPR